MDLIYMIHVWYIYTYIYHKNQPSVAVNIPYMDFMGYIGRSPIYVKISGSKGEVHAYFFKQLKDWWIN